MKRKSFNAAAFFANVQALRSPQKMRGVFTNFRRGWRTFAPSLDSKTQVTTLQILNHFAEQKCFSAEEGAWIKRKIIYLEKLLDADLQSVNPNASDNLRAGVRLGLKNALSGLHSQAEAQFGAMAAQTA